MRRPLLIAALGGPAAVAAVAGALAGCPSTAATTTYTPITGIQIPPSILAGHGCGTGPDQVYRYLAVVSYADDAGAPVVGEAGALGPVASQVFECYAPAIFSNLPTTVGSAYSIAIYAWNRESFPAALDCTTAPCPAEDAAAYAPFLPPAGVTPLDAGAADGGSLADAGVSSVANWTTTCTAAQEAGATQIAYCPCPLAPPGTSGCVDAAAADAAAGPDAGDAGPALGSISVSLTAFPVADGGTIRCGTDYESAFASFTGSVDGGNPVVMGETPWVACPQALVITGANPAYAYQLNVTLSNAADGGVDGGAEGGSVVASTTCSASPEADASVTATCAPAKLGP